MRIISRMRFAWGWWGSRWLEHMNRWFFTNSYLVNSWIQTNERKRNIKKQYYKFNFISCSFHTSLIWSIFHPAWVFSISIDSTTTLQGLSCPSCCSGCLMSRGDVIVLAGCRWREFWRRGIGRGLDLGKWHFASESHYTFPSVYSLFLEPCFCSYPARTSNYSSPDSYSLVVAAAESDD